ncbi:MAG: adenylosuccinate lyase [Candidatus Handelsmanbacteria bacterium]|nr:adenylosuccinate lyase [Candidatus Handelsmanbacteria bacterium]
MTHTIPNALASRYASPQMCELWSEPGRILLEREFWIAVLRAQRELGLDIPAEAIAAYERVKGEVDTGSIARREAQLRHDVKARIEEFCHLAGSENLHQGLTSRDLTDNVEQYQILRSLQLARVKYAALLLSLGRRAEQWKGLVVVGRTHHAPAQPTTLGKRLAMFGEEMLQAFGRLEHLIDTYPLRGLKGAVGTALDQATLFEGDFQKVEALQQQVLFHLGFGRQLNAVGQIYPRSLDFDVISCLYQLGAGVSSLARTLRLMAGAELATEGFAKGQVGSSAMPHKMNTRTSERINGLQVVLGGYLHMAGALAGDQWFEGDVSCSVVRRVALPDAFFAFDGLVEAALHVLDEMGVFEAVIAAELARYLPFLATTTLLMEAVRAGAGRETAHEAIREHAVAVALEMREQVAAHNDLARRLGDDPRLPLDRAQIEALLARGQDFIGLALAQTEAFVGQVAEVGRRLPEAGQVQKARLL